MSLTGEAVVVPAFYRPLISSTAIRLLCLHPGTYADPIECIITHANLCDSPNYEAISYTWGTDGDKQTIQINGENIDIRRNLAQCLRRIRSEEHVRTVWVDAICISQTDLAEKAAQVQMINKIFSGARRVVAWVGEHADHSEELFAYCKEQAAMWSNADGRYSDSVILPWHIAVEREESLKSIITYFASRSYFSRVWIIQEIALARSIDIQCGQSALPWTILFHRDYGIPALYTQTHRTKDRAVKYRHDDQLFLQYAAERTPMMLLCQLNALRQDFQHLKNRIDEPLSTFKHSDLPTISAIYRDNQCFDRRDRMFALQSIDARGLGAKDQVTVNYTVEIPELFLEVCRTKLDLNPDLIVVKPPFAHDAASCITYADIEREADKKYHHFGYYDHEALPRLMIGLHLTPAEFDQILGILQSYLEAERDDWRAWCILSWRVLRMFTKPSRQTLCHIDILSQQEALDVIAGGSVFKGIAVLRARLAMSELGPSTKRQ